MDETQELLETALDVLRALQRMSDGRGRTYCATCKQPECLPDYCQHGAVVLGLAAALENKDRAAVRVLEAAADELESALQAAASELTQKQEAVARALHALRPDDDDDEEEDEEEGAVIE